MAQHHPLGHAGGPRGIYDGQEIFRGDGRAVPQEAADILIGEAPVGQQVGIGIDIAEEGVHLRTADHEDPPELPAAFEIVAVQVEELAGFNHHEGAVGLLDDVFEFMSRGIGAPGHRHRTEGHDGQIGDDPGVAVVGQQDHLVPPAHAPATEGPGEEEDILEELAVGHLAVFLAGRVDKSDLLPEPVGAGGQDLKKRRRRFIVRDSERVQQHLFGHGFFPQCTAIVPIMNLR